MPNTLAHIPGSDSLFELPAMLSDPPGFLRQRYEQHGDVFRSRWVVPLVFLVGPAANKMIHVTRRSEFGYRLAYRDVALGKLFDGSLLMSDGPKHQHDRDILQPAMGRLALQGTLDAVRAIWTRAVDGLKDGDEIDAYDFMRDVTFEVSANALVDLDLKEELALFKPLFQQLVDGAMASTPFRIPFLKLDRGLKAREQLCRRLEPKIDEARKRDAKGMLGLLAQHREPNGDPLPSRAIAEHVLLLFWAGYDTTASTGGWALHELSQAPQWQDRLVDEQQQLPRDRLSTMEEIDHLARHGWVLKEVERLRPSVLFFPRRVLEDLEVNGKAIPKDTLVFYSAWLTHRIPELFKDPDAFKPERWDPALGKDVAPSTALVGFGGGPRICLGKAFALLQLRVMLTTLLSRFRLTPVEGAKPKTIALPMYRPQGARLRLSRR